MNDKRDKRKRKFITQTVVSTMVPCDIWERGIMVCVGPYEAAKIHLRKRVGLELPEALAEEVADKGTKAFCLLLDGTDEPVIWAPGAMSLETLVHELSHATTHILEKVGAGDCDEARSHTLGHLFARCLRELAPVGGLSFPDALSHTPRSRSVPSGRHGKRSALDTKRLA